jgi:Protein of unknown function (DUF3489)
VFDEDLESGEWRIFRLFLVSLEDEDVKHVSKQLEKELQARRDCENSAARLFFSSLAASDLTLARQAISNERAARAQERRTQASFAVRGSGANQPRVESEPRSQSLLLASAASPFLRPVMTGNEICLAFPSLWRDECRDHGNLLPQGEISTMNVSEKTAVETAAQDTVPKTRVAKPRARAAKPPAKRVKGARKPSRQRKAAAPRLGTKTAKILALLRRSSGATLQELRKATGWQAHSVRGFLSGTLKKRMGQCVDSALTRQWPACLPPGFQIVLQSAGLGRRGPAVFLFISTLPAVKRGSNPCRGYAGIYPHVCRGGRIPTKLGVLRGNLCTALRVALEETQTNLGQL